jgi:hypothetical protein
MANTTRAQLLCAELSVRKPGAVASMVVLALDWIAKLNEHIVLSYVTDHLKEEPTVIAMLQWAMDHPFKLFVVLVLLYALAIIIKAKHSEEAESPAGPILHKEKHQTTHGVQSPINTAGRDVVQHFHGASTPPDVSQGVVLVETILGRAPGILIHYECDGGRKESLTFTNEGPEAAFNVEIGKLRCHGEYDIDLEHPLPPIPANEKQACRIYFKNGPHSSIDLHSFLWSEIKAGQEASVIATYESRSGKFTRAFALTAHDRGAVIWKPGPIDIRHADGGCQDTETPRASHSSTTIERNAATEKSHSATCPRVIMQCVTVEQRSRFELTARNSDAFEIEVHRLDCGDGVIGWSLSKSVLLSGETMSATIHEIGKSGNTYNYEFRLLELGLGRLTSAKIPTVERSILITYRDPERRQWQTECPIRYDRRIGRAQFLTPIFSLRQNATLTDQKTLEALKQLLPNEGGIMQLRNQSFWGRFPWDADAVLISFLQRDTGPEHGFLDEHLEGLRQQLHETITLLLDRVHRYSDPPSKISDASSGNFRFFWKQDNESIATYDARRNEVFEAAKRVCGIYDDLVLTARRKFEV